MSNPKLITLNNATRAGNPAGASISVLRYARYYPKWPLLWIILIAASIVPVWLVSLWFLFLLALALLCPVFYWIHIRERFRYGDANPGIVVQVNPTLVAVWTDLRKGFGSYPAVKVFRTTLTRSMGRPVQVGLRLPTVAVYQGLPQDNSPHWWDFDPRPLECATSDRQTLDRVMASFSHEQCDLLDAAVQELPSIQPGLYRPTEDGWTHFQGFSFRAIYRASQTPGFDLAFAEQARMPFVASLIRLRDDVKFPRFTWVTGGIILLCLFGTVGLAMHLGTLWMIPGPPTRSTWRILFILGGANLALLLLGMLIGSAYIGRKYPDPAERATKRRRFLFSVAAFTLSFIAEEWARWSHSTPAWLHPVCEAITIVGVINFAKTVHSVLLRRDQDQT